MWASAPAHLFSLLRAHPTLNRLQAPEAQRRISPALQRWERAEMDRESRRGGATETRGEYRLSGTATAVCHHPWQTHTQRTIDRTKRANHASSNKTGIPQTSHLYRTPHLFFCSRRVAKSRCCLPSPRASSSSVTESHQWRTYSHVLAVLRHQIIVIKRAPNENPMAAPIHNNESFDTNSQHPPIAAISKAEK